MVISSFIRSCVIPMDVDDYINERIDKENLQIYLIKFVYMNVIIHNQLFFPYPKICKFDINKIY